MPDQIDLDLLRLAAGGDRAAWDSLILRHYERLVRWGRKFVKSEDDARDIAQDTFRKLYQARNLPLDGSATFTTYLFKVMRNVAIDFVKARKRKGSTASLPSDLHAPADDHRREVQQDILNAIDRLPENLKVVVIMRFFDGLTLAEIGRTMGVVEATVFNHLKNALTILRGLLSDWMDEIP